MQRIMVDLPEPEGPQTTIFWPFSTMRLMSRRTWNSPYHLLTFRSSIIGRLETALAVADIVFPRSAFMGVRKVGFDLLAVLRHGEAEDEVDDRDEDIGLDAEAAPGRLDGRDLGRAQQIVNADDNDQRGVLEHADEGVDQR